MKTVLSIAGTDPSGGAGIQADLKTFAAHDVYGMAAITALVAQNTHSVTRIEAVIGSMIEAQLESVFTDIFPDAVKIGMIPNREAVCIVAQALMRWAPSNIVLDPVMISSSGKRLLAEDALTPLKEQLLPLVQLVTPNRMEAEILCGFLIHTTDDAERALRLIHADCGAAVLLKGGHEFGKKSANSEIKEKSECVDILFDGTHTHFFRSPRINTLNTHGTGCTLSSAIASNLALGFPLHTAVERAKRFLSGALSSGLDLGRGSGPLDHGWNRSYGL